MKSYLSLKKLKKGDKVALVAPAGSISKEQLEMSRVNIESLGLRVVYSSDITAKYGYMAGTEQRRLDELHFAFRDKEIKAIICVRGGYGSMRLLPHIDFDLIAANQKVFVGYSDITSLLNAITQKTGMVTFHAPMAASVFSPFVRECYKYFLFDNDTSIQPNCLEENAQTIAGGTAAGALCGGNLVLTAALCGTPYEICMDNKIVFFEEIGETPYRIDRLWTQLLLAGCLQNAKGIILGSFTNCESKNNKADQWLLSNVISDRLSALGIPVLSGLKAGHINDNMVLPIGGEIEMDANNCMVKFPV